MALNPQFATATVNGEADYIGTLLDNGYLRVYDGQQPESADDAITDQVLLAELRFAADAFPAAVDGVITSNALTSDASANATGTAAWCRLFKSDGTTVVMDGTVGTADANVIINTVDIVAAAVISAPSPVVIAVPKAGEVLADDAEV